MKSTDMTNAHALSTQRHSNVKVKLQPNFQAYGSLTIKAYQTFCRECARLWRKLSMSASCRGSMHVKNLSDPCHAACVSHFHELAHVWRKIDRQIEKKRERRRKRKTRPGPGALSTRIQALTLLASRLCEDNFPSKTKYWMTTYPRTNIWEHNERE